MTAVAACLVTQRNHDRPSFRDTLDLTLEDPKLGRIDQVVGGIDGQKRCTNFFKVRSGIIIMSSFERVQNVVCIVSLDDLFNEFVQDFVCFRK